MTRYAKQRDRFSCGPTAVINAMKWSGYQISYREELEKYVHRYGCLYPEGVHPEILAGRMDAMQELDIRREINKPKLSDLNRELRKGRALILCHPHAYRGGHYILCIGETKHFYKVVNRGSSRKTVSYISKKVMRKMLRRDREMTAGRYHAVAWSISR